MSVRPEQWRSPWLASLAALALAGCSQAPDPPRLERRAAVQGAALYGTTIQLPRAAPRLQVGQDERTGAPIEVACGTCHAGREPVLENGAMGALETFHQALDLQHGSLTCLACHDARNYDRLQLAGGQALGFQDSMQLCAQCHAKRHEDYQHGAHGGMSGHWDLMRGPRTRKHCIDCHDPHAPAFPKMRPTFKPKDRFLRPLDSSPHADASHD